MKDFEMTLTLNSPITEEQWDIIADVDFDYTDNITFHTKHGKEVEFVKRKTGRWINVDTVIKELGAECFAKRINGELIALGGIEDYAELRGMEVEHD